MIALRVSLLAALAALALASCQTTGPAKDQAASELLGKLQGIPAIMERCQGIDPGNARFYAEEKRSYQTQNKWVEDAAYRVLSDKLGSTREGVEGLIRGITQRRVEAFFSGRTKDEVEKGCMKVLADCRLGQPSCAPLERTMQAEVKAVTAIGQ